MLIWLLFVLLAAMVAAVIALFYQLSQLLTLDATARNLAHPKVTAVLAAGTQNGVGLLAYLALRRGHPIDATRDDPHRRERLKIGTIAAFAMLLISGICTAMLLLSGQI